MKTILFSRVFPAYHPRKGEHTYFVEKIWAHLIKSGQYTEDQCNAYLAKYYQECCNTFEPPPIFKVLDFVKTGGCKIHTIRSGHRWKPGDVFDPRIWSGKPYCSPQIT